MAITIVAFAFVWMSREKICCTDFYLFKNEKKEDNVIITDETILDKFCFRVDDITASEFVGKVYLPKLNSLRTLPHENGGLYSNGLCRVIFLNFGKTVTFETQHIPANMEIAGGLFVFDFLTDFSVTGGLITGLATQNVYYDAPIGDWRKDEAHQTKVEVKGKVDVAGSHEKRGMLQLIQTHFVVEDTGFVGVGESSQEERGSFVINHARVEMLDSVIRAKSIRSSENARWCFYGNSVLESQVHTRFLGEIEIECKKQAYASDCVGDKNDSKVVFKGVILAPVRIKSILGYDREAQKLSLGMLETDYADFSNTTAEVILLDSFGFNQKKNLSKLKGTRLAFLKCKEKISKLPKILISLDQVRQALIEADIKLEMQYDSDDNTIYVVVR